jgi:hypothetical protein
VTLGAAAARSGQNSMHNTSEVQARTPPIYERRAQPTTNIWGECVVACGACSRRAHDAPCRAQPMAAGTAGR